ncbi:hypothetical protein [Rhizobium ruizarguesonis]|uniref:hypothetical protein n=1 Tax=Rhizobium ruizarguesonis TaxID=2081791 RepID=UPI0013BBE993|nr:hypothetical protein [Rhizobium ruizarguesonis]NEH61726.1 hypothetical protein [Rhizobium ruizarguesonis]
MSALIYRKVFADFPSLRDLAKGRIPSLDDVKRRIFVVERRSDPFRPDHFYKGYLDHRLGEARTLGDLTELVLKALANNFIERRSGRLSIQGPKFLEWQHLLPSISPLAVITTFLTLEGRGPVRGIDPREFLYNEIGDTAILSPALPEFERLEEKYGLNEIHMHLNGSTELDILWLDAVCFPKLYHAELNAARRGSGLPDELYDQMEFNLRPYELYRRLRAARRIRHLVAKVAAGETLFQNVTQQQLVEAMTSSLADHDCGLVQAIKLSKNPSRVEFGDTETPPLIDEAAFMYSAMQSWSGGPKHTRNLVNLGLYFNFLVLNQITRIAVQQTDEVGFDQFQKYTLVGSRDKLERSYSERFRQLNRKPPYASLAHLEGRFAPKKTMNDVMALLDRIVKGYLEFRGCSERVKWNSVSRLPPCISGPCSGVICKTPKRGRSDAEFALVAHFIKRTSKQKGRHRQARDSQARSEALLQARLLRYIINKSPAARQLIRGIDAAANELHAPPEAFAPAFRLLRRGSVDHATYHVGEDFLHLVSGIRATVEAVRFLSLGVGDRVGHATALGISPQLWLDRTGERIIVPRSQWLDNLVFAGYLLVGHPEHAALVQRIQRDVSTLSAAMYGREQNIAVLDQEWRLRHLDILTVLRLERETGAGQDSHLVADAAKDLAQTVADEALRAELDLIRRAAIEEPAAYQLFRKRHSNADFNCKPIEIDTAYFPESALSALQEMALQEVNRAGVAIETLPTSNIRISLYQNHTEHHVFRWLGVAEGSVLSKPIICVGSDDTGIFATNIHNEYALLIQVLTTKYGKTVSEATELIWKLNESSAARRFRPLREKA